MSRGSSNNQEAEQPLTTARRAILSLVPMGLVAGCLSTASRQATTTDRTASGTASKASKLATPIQEVARSSEPEATAEARGLQTRDGRVLVVIELRPDQDVPSDADVVVTSRTDEGVFAYVGYDDLESVASHRNVSLVRPPREVS